MLRRGFLAAILGTPIVAPTALGRMVVDPTPTLAGNTNLTCSGETDPWWRHTGEVHDRVWGCDEYEEEERAKAMKSWSPVYRRHIARQTARRRASLRQRFGDARQDRDLPALIQIAKEVSLGPAEIAKMVARLG